MKPATRASATVMGVTVRVSAVPGRKARDQRTRAEALDLRAKWDDLDIDRRHQVVQALAERIEVGPALKGRNLYTPGRVKVTYR